MTEPRQRPIPVTRQERATLDERKRRYEESTGDQGDWGRFLGTMTLLGLAAAGIYALARVRERSANSVNVECATCGRTFLMAVPDQVGGAVYITCPHCGEELVVHLGYVTIR